MFPNCFHYKRLIKILQKNCAIPPYIVYAPRGGRGALFFTPHLFSFFLVIKCKGSFTIYKLPYPLAVRNLLNHSLYLFCSVNRWRPFKECVFKEYNAFRTILMVIPSPDQYILNLTDSFIWI